MKLIIGFEVEIDPDVPGFKGKTAQECAVMTYDQLMCGDLTLDELFEHSGRTEPLILNGYDE